MLTGSLHCGTENASQQRRGGQQRWPERRSLAASPVERLVAAFGGNISLCSQVIKAAPATLYRWRGSWDGGLGGCIPEGRKRDILLRCREAGVELDAADLDVQPDDLVSTQPTETRHE